METNWLIYLVAAIIPILMGFIWYHPKVLGNTWMQVAGITEEKIKESNMGAILGVTFVLSLMLSFVTGSLVIHQHHFGSVLMNEPGFGDPQSAIGQYMSDFYAKYGQNFRTFRHGALHGVIAAVFLALPLIGINALFERRGWKYILLHTGYWTVTLSLMGGIICLWS